VPRFANEKSRESQQNREIVRRERHKTPKKKKKRKRKKKCHQTFIESHKKKKKKKSGFDTKEKRAKAENCINFQQSRYSVNISTSSGYTTDNCSQKLLVSE
jgi:hypothetical protein